MNGESPLKVVWLSNSDHGVVRKDQSHEEVMAVVVVVKDEEHSNEGLCRV